MESEQGSKLTLTVPEVAALLGISRGTAYEAIRLGQIPSLRFGRRVVIPKAALQRLLDGEQEGTHGEHEEASQ